MKLPLFVFRSWGLIALFFFRMIKSPESIGPKRNCLKLEAFTTDPASPYVAMDIRRLGLKLTPSM